MHFFVPSENQIVLGNKTLQTPYLQYFQRTNNFNNAMLMKFYKENNYSDFTREEIKRAVHELCAYLHITPDKMKITLLEFGLNILTEYPPDYYFDVFRDYKTRPFIPMRPLPGTPKIAGINCNLSQYDIKFYDKTWEAIRRGKVSVKERYLIPSNLLRFEIRFKSPKVRSIRTLINGEDLYSPAFLNELKYELNYIYENIYKLNVIADFNGFRQKDIREYLFIKSELYQSSYIDNILRPEGKEVMKTEKKRKHKSRL